MAVEYEGTAVYFYRDLERLKSSWTGASPDDPEGIPRSLKFQVDSLIAMDPGKARETIRDVEMFDCMGGEYGNMKYIIVSRIYSEIFPSFLLG